MGRLGKRSPKRRGAELKTEMKKIWLFVESVNPPRWGIRYGREWHVVKQIAVKIVMEGRTARRAPNTYLFGIGRIAFEKDKATLYFMTKD